MGKNLLIAVSLTPMFLQEAVSLSADGLVFAVLAADVTLFICLLKREAPMTRRERVLLVLLCALTLSVKPLYFVFILPFAFLPADRFGGSRRRTLLIAYGCSVALALVWLGPMLLGQDMTTAKRRDVDVSLHRQLLGILADPLEYLRCLTRTLVEKGEFYINSSMSSFLYLTVGLPGVFTFAQYALLGYTCAREGVLGEYPRARRVLLACSLLSALVIFTGGIPAVDAGRLSGGRGRAGAVLRPPPVPRPAVHDAPRGRAGCPLLLARRGHADRDADALCAEHTELRDLLNVSALCAHCP